jgi:5-methylcytosine-specific restriction enzyme B
VGQLIPVLALDEQPFPIPDCLEIPGDGAGREVALDWHILTTRAAAAGGLKAPKDRKLLMARYKELRNLQIFFVTFHPSFSYEEFVEGIRPEMDGDKVRYRVKPGVFLQAVTRANELLTPVQATAPFEVKDRRVFKMSLGDSTNPDEDWIFQDCLDNNYVCLGFGSNVNFDACDTQPAVRDRYVENYPNGLATDFAITAIHRMKNELKNGDLVVISDGNSKFRAIAVVNGGYSYEARTGGYEQRRAVKWLWHSDASLPVDKIFNKRLSQMSIYLMDQKALKRPSLQDLLSPKVEAGKVRNCVLIIDEINRANLAKTFGELITLLEPSKRLGGDDEQEAILPYSSEGLTIPPNLYVIGTLNTADRSIAVMDTALRRRFAFIEMPPRPSLLAKDVAGIDLQALLEAMNIKIEVLFDRDHGRSDARGDCGGVGGGQGVALVVRDWSGDRLLLQRGDQAGVWDQHHQVKVPHHRRVGGGGAELFTNCGVIYF